MSWKTWLGALGAAGALAWLAFEILKDPDARDGILWALRSWVRPPDADAGWQQGPG